MKAVELKNKNISVVQIPEPQIQNPYDIKIKIAYSSICGYDIMGYRGIVNYNYNTLIGHEASGIVVETGNAVTSVKQGENVSISPHISCGNCHYCRKGHPEYCHMEASYSPPPMMAEYIVVNETQVFKLQDSISLLEGCLTEPLTLCIRCLEKAHLEIGSTLLIIGGGAMGLLILQLARRRGASAIVVMEPNESKQKLALYLGATSVVNPNEYSYASLLNQYTDGYGYDAVIEASGNFDAAHFAFNYVTRGGHIVYFSMYDPTAELPVNMLNLYWKDAMMSAVLPPPNSYFRKAIEIEPYLDLRSVITGIFPYQEAKKAFEEKAGHAHAKVVLDFTV